MRRCGCGYERPWSVASADPNLSLRAACPFRAIQGRNPTTATITPSRSSKHSCLHLYSVCEGERNEGVKESSSSFLVAHHMRGKQCACQRASELQEGVMMDVANTVRGRTPQTHNPANPRSPLTHNPANTRPLLTHAPPLRRAPARSSAA